VTWLTTKFDNVIAAARRAGADDLSAHAWQLVQAVSALCRHRGQFSEGVALHEFGATLARQQGDKLREAIAYHCLAGTLLGAWPDEGGLRPLPDLDLALRAIGDHDREMRATGNLGALHELLGAEVSARVGDQREALERGLRAQRIFDSLGVPDAERVARRLGEMVG
jgi:hypothetical protein